MSIENRLSIAGDLRPVTKPTSQPLNARQRLPLSPQSGLQLTPKGERYALAHSHDEHGQPGDYRSWRAGIEAEVERLIAILDQFDGEPDLETDEDFEPSIGVNSALGPDLEFDDAERGEPFEPTDLFPNGAHLGGGGSGI